LSIVKVIVLIIDLEKELEENGLKKNEKLLG
jgi:hypothetical protein